MSWEMLTVNMCVNVGLIGKFCLSGISPEQFYIPVSLLVFKIWVFLFSGDESIEINRRDGFWLNVGFGIDSWFKAWCLPEKGFAEIFLADNND